MNLGWLQTVTPNSIIGIQFMKNIIPLVAMLFSLFLCGCHFRAESDKYISSNSSIKGSATSSTNAQAYEIKAGGPYYVTLITNTPETNPVSISLVTQADDWLAAFLVKNGEAHSILVWNVRVQVPSKGRGTDGFGWDTVSDDYPDGQAKIARGMSGKFSVKHPREQSWRICVIYSTDWSDTGKSHSGNYEVISQQISQ